MVPVVLLRGVYQDAAVSSRSVLDSGLDGGGHDYGKNLCWEIQMQTIILCSGYETETLVGQNHVLD